MRQRTNSMLKTASLVIGIMLTAIGVILFVTAGLSYKPYSEAEQRPFDIAVKLDGSETHAKFTAPKSEFYQVGLNIVLPRDEANKRDLYWCLLMPPTEVRSDCAAVPDRFVTEWAIADANDKAWHEWSTTTTPGYAIVDGQAGNSLGWFQAKKDHRYIVTFRATTSYAKLKSARADLRATLGDKGAQMEVAFGGFFAGLLAFESIPFFLVGIPLILIGRRRKSPTAANA